MKVLALFIASIFFCLIIMEVAARMLLPAPLPWLYPQVRYESDPAAGFVLQPRQSSFSADEPTEINERGLRGPLVPYDQTPGVPRLLFLGDSIGFGVSTADATPALVQRLFSAGGRRVESINAGVPSYNTLQAVTWLETKGLAYDPGRVIVLTCWNDINDKSGVRVHPNGYLVSFEAALRKAKGKASSWESPAAYRIRNLMKRSRLFHAARRGVQAIISLWSPDPRAEFRSQIFEGVPSERVESGWHMVASSFDRLRELSASRGFRAMVVSFPSVYGLQRASADSFYPSRMLRLAESRGFEIIDLKPVFEAGIHAGDTLFVNYDDVHPNDAGHTLAARQIVDAIGPAL